MANMMAYRVQGGKWGCPPTAEGLKESSLCSIEHYLNKRQQHIVDYNSTRPIWLHYMVANKQPHVPAHLYHLLVESEQNVGTACGRALGDGTPCL